MNLEHHIASAPSPAITPQTRYASLHRSIEKGMHCDATYVELVKVCVILKKHDEALRTFEKVKSPRERIHLQNLLLNHQVLASPVLTPEDCGIEHGDTQPPTHKDDVVSACHFLFQDHMPLTAITLTLAFPLVIGLGGFLSQKMQAGWFANIAILPAVFTLMIVFGLARRILLDARQDLDDAPSLAGSRDLLIEGALALADVVMLGALLLGPGIVMTQIDLSLPGALLALALGGFLLPMALVLRIVRCDWHALHPQVLFTTIVRGGLPYVKTSATIAGAFLPALLCGIATSGSKLYLCLSVIGPLVVVPVFIAARLLGRLVDSKGDKLVLAEPLPEALARVTNPPSEAHLVRLSKSGSVPVPRKQSQLKRIANTPAPRPVKPPVQHRSPAPVRQEPARQEPARQAPLRPAAHPAADLTSAPKPAPSPRRAAPAPAPATPARGQTRPATPRSPAPAPTRHAGPAARRSPEPSTAELPPELAHIPGLVARPGSSRQQGR